MNEEQLRAICEVLGTQKHLTHPILNQMLAECGIRNQGRESVQQGLGYIAGDSKPKKLHKSFNGIDTNLIYKFIEKAVAPASYTSTDKREAHKALLEELNKILLLDGKQINASGKIAVVPKASNLDEVDRRVNSLAKQLYERKIHAEVQRYCRKDLLEKNYFEAVFEAAKGMAERVRSMSGLTTDGSALFQTTFSTDPAKAYLFFNNLTTDSEKNEQNGLRELMDSIFHLVRNPQAHTPKMNWPIEEDKTLDILTLISFAHKYLDMCHKMPGKS